MKVIEVLFLRGLFCAVFAVSVLSWELRKMIRKGERKLFIRITAVILAGVAFYGSLYLLDLPQFFAGEPETARGHVVSHDSAGREDVSDTRGITIETETGERIELLTLDTPIHLDEYLHIAYLPHIHIGYIVERIAE